MTDKYNGPSNPFDEFKHPPKPKQGWGPDQWGLLLSASCMAVALIMTVLVIVGVM